MSKKLLRLNKSALFFICALLFCIPGVSTAAVLSRPANNLGLVGYWSFNDISGAYAGDSSGSGYTGTLSGSTLPAWVAGKHGSALQFDGSSSHVDLGAPPGPVDAVTIAAWVKLSGYSPWASIVDRYGDENLDCLSLGFDSSTGQKLMFMWDNAAPYYNRVTADSNLPLDEWVHVAASSDGSNVIFYINGVQDGTQAVGAPCATGDLVLGANFPGDDEYMNGVMDDVRVYNRALSDTEVAALYHAGQVQLATRSGGLEGDFYDGINFDTYVSSAVDTTVNFNPADTPIGVNRANGGDTFSARWTGYVRADYGETYTFYTSSDDGVRLYVNGTTVINNWTDHGTTENSGTIGLDAGRWYPITLEFYENGGGSAITLSYSSASVSKTIIPASNLQHGLGTATIGVNTAGGSLVSGLVGYWSFNGGDLTDKVYDRSGNGNNAYVNSGAATSSMKVAGKLGQALQLNGSSNYVRVATLSGTPSSAMTLCAWAKTSYTGANQYILNINRNPGNLINEGIFEIMSSTGKLRFWDYNGSAYGFADGGSDSTTAVADGAWHHVCFVKNSTAGTYYLDGASDGTATASLNVSYGSSDWVMGYNYRDGNLGFNGTLDEVRVYNRALSASEIQQLYRTGK